MAFENCIEEIKAASGDKIDDAEAGRILRMAFERAGRYEKDGMSRAAATVKAAQELGTEEKIKAAVAKRNLLINIERRRELNAGVIEGKENLSVRAALVGVEGDERGWGYSADAQALDESVALLGGVVGDLRKAGLLKVALRRDIALERDITREMWRQQMPDRWPATGNKIAAQMAEILGRYNELARVKQNEVGAYIRKIDTYVTRQSHDRAKIRGDGTDAAFATWRDAIEPKLDELTFEGVEDRGTFLRDVWLALSSGIHDSANGAEWLAGFKGAANLGRKVSEERSLHFKSADDWFAYNEQFGKGGGILHGVMRNLEHAGRNIALMRRFGPNPEAMVKDWVDTLARKARDRADFKEADALRADWNNKLLDAVTRRGSIPDHMGLAQVGQAVRNIETITKLGGVVLSSIPDIAISAGTLRWNGIPFFERWGRMIAAPLQGRRSGAERVVADEFGFGIDTLTQQILSRFYAADGVPGAGAKLVQTFHRLNLLSYWTDSMKTTVGLVMSSKLAQSVGREFAALDARQQITLRRFGIEAPEWNAMRRAELRAEDGRDYLMPGSMLALPDEAIAHLAPENATARQLNQIREDLRSKLGTFVSEQTREAMTEPTAGDRALATLGTHPGTWIGEGLRLLMQFKQFPMTLIRRSLNREWNRGERVDIGGLAQLMISTTLLGYAALTAKEYAKGRNPRAPWETGNPQDYAKTVMAAMQQGGGLGFYGDFLLGQANQFGGGLAGFLGGPAVGTLEQAFQMFQTIRDGGAHKTRGELLGAEGVRFLAQNTPMVNLFYTKLALDHLFIYGLQEAANPGYLRRYEQRVKRDNAQTFWLRPSQAVQY